MQRPTGVTILAILAFIAACFMLLGGLLLTVAGTVIGAMANPLFAALGAFGGILIIILGALYALVGYGLWTLKSWAWILTVVLAGLGFAFNLLQLLAGDIAGGLVGFIVNGVVLWYMMQPQVKTAFGRA